MIPTHIVIPVRDRIDLTTSIVHQLWGQPGWDRLTIYDNGSSEPTRRYLEMVSDNDDRIVIRRTSQMGIYDMWRDGFEQAQHEHPGSVNVAILNNDISMAPHTIEHLATALRSRFELVLTYPDYDLPATATPDGAPHLRITKGTYKDGGMAGFCFMLAADRVTWSPLVDMEWEWWYGDDSIAWHIEEAGGLQARVEGLGLHHETSSTANATGWVAEAIARDARRFAERAGR